MALRALCLLLVAGLVSAAAARAQTPRVRSGVGGTRSGMATLGGNPAARDASALALLRFLATHLAEPT